MIATTSYGYYDVSLDGGRHFTRTDNMLLTGFYASLTGTLYCQVGEGVTQVAFTNTTLTNAITSSAGTSISSVNTYDAARDKVIITSQYEFSFAANTSKTLTEIGIRQGSTLVSRALFKAPVVVTAIDVLLVRYTLVTEIDMREYPISLTLSGVVCTGKVIKCNPNQWQQTSFGSLKQSTKYGVLINGNYTRDATGYLSGSGTVVSGYNCVITETGSANSKVAAHTVSSGLEATDQTFNVIALSDSNSASANIMMALIVFDAPVLRANDNIVNISLTITQGA